MAGGISQEIVCFFLSAYYLVFYYYELVSFNIELWRIYKRIKNLHNIHGRRNHLQIVYHCCSFCCLFYQYFIFTCFFIDVVSMTCVSFPPTRMPINNFCFHWNPLELSTGRNRLGQQWLRLIRSSNFFHNSLQS